MKRVWSESSNLADHDEVARPTISGHDEEERTTTEPELSERASAFSIDSLLSDLPRHVHAAPSSGKNYYSFS